MDGALGGLMQMTELIIIAAVGFVAAKLNYLDKYTNQKMTKLLLNITLPCMIVASVHGLSAEDAGAIVVPAFLMAGAQFFLLLLTGALIAIVLRVPKKDRAIWQFMTVGTNTGFIGLPVIAAILGQESIIISSIYIMIIALFLYSVGFAILENNRERAKRQARIEEGKALPVDTESAQMRKRKVSVPWRSMVNPSMVACVIALVLFFTGLQVPDLLQDTMSLLGGITAPIAMLVIGVIMAGTNIRAVLTEVRLYPYIVVRQLVLPALFFWGFTAAGISPLLAGVFALMFAMPVGSMTPTFVEEFDGNATLAAEATVLTTLGAFAAIPLLVIFMGMVA
ncbi:AEC family transporter [Anaerotardibacter muris]|uniref:AEC family transporter n=1 Tax=Anaerotardibacter muris TaxID=2941505 RepID=UPI00203DFC8C|nr:AEC family transporter [Anaerotardibacter muris]